MVVLLVRRQRGQGKWYIASITTKVRSSGPSRTFGISKCFKMSSTANTCGGRGFSLPGLGAGNRCVKIINISERLVVVNDGVLLYLTGGLGSSATSSPSGRWHHLGTSSRGCNSRRYISLYQFRGNTSYFSLSWQPVSSASVLRTQHLNEKLNHWKWNMTHLSLLDWAEVWMWMLTLSSRPTRVRRRFVR